MLTSFIRSINWIDVLLAALFIRLIFVGVKNGFLSEFFKLLGVVCAVFVSLHYYSYLADLIIRKTNLVWVYWDLVIFAVLWFAVIIFFKYLREGILILFKVETNHQGFDKYAAGVVAVGRGILIGSLAIFLILLTHYGPLTRMSLHSYSYKIAGRAAVGTYSFLYKNLVGKLYPHEQYNAQAAMVLSSVGK